MGAGSELGRQNFQRFGRTTPNWVRLVELAHGAQAPLSEAPPELPAQGTPHAREHLFPIGRAF